MPTPEPAVARIAPADVDAGTWERLTGGSFFASPGFLALWATRGGRAVAWLATLDGVPAAAIPGVEFGRGPLARFVSLPDGCYGGVFCAPAAEAGRPRLARALLAAIARRHYAKAIVYDFRATAGEPAAFARAFAETSRVDISAPGWEPPDPKLRAQARRASRAGIRVERFDWERHHAGFLALVRGTARHHGVRPRYAAAFYHALAALAARDPRVLWLHAELGGRPVASHLYFLDGESLQAWQSHFDRSFAFLHPNAFLRLGACRAAARDGARWLNLGATPAGAAGVAAYKARWGGQRVRFPVWTSTGTPGLLADALRGHGVRGAGAPSRWTAPPRTTLLPR